MTDPRIPARLRPLLREARFDPALAWHELLTLLALVLEQELGEAASEEALRFLEANLPGARLRDLIDWPGDWFGNRWLEEIVLAPDEVAAYALARCRRELPGAPPEPELPFPPPPAS